MAGTTLRVSTSSIARAILITGAAAVVAMVATRATTTLWWFVEAATIAALASPAVHRLGRRMPTFVAVLVLTALVAVVVAGLAASGLREVQNESTKFRDSVPAAVRELETDRTVGPVIRDLHLADDLGDFGDELSDRVRFKGADLPGLASKVGGGASAVFVVWVLSVMLIFTGPTIIESAIGQLGSSRRGQVEWILGRAHGHSVRYLALMSVHAIAAGVSAFLIATALGLEMPAMLAVVAGLCAFVPYVGLIAASLPIALMAALDGPTRALAVITVAIVVQALDAVVVQRRIDRATVPLGVFPTLVAALIGFSLRGPGGMLVAVTIVAMAIAVVGDTAAMRALRTVARRGSLEPLADEPSATPPTGAAERPTGPEWRPQGT